MRIAWLSAAPASPDCSTFTLMPVCFVNAAQHRFDTANESWVTSVTVVDGAAAAASRAARARRSRDGDVTQRGSASSDATHQAPFRDRAGTTARSTPSSSETVALGAEELVADAARRAGRRASRGAAGTAARR